MDTNNETKSDNKSEAKGDGEAEGSRSKEEKSVRLFHDDTFKGFFRRLAWSNDGE